MSLMAARSAAVARRMLGVIVKRLQGRIKSCPTLADRRQAERHVWRRQVAGAHQEHVNRPRRPAALIDGPDDERLAATAIAARKHLGQAGGELAVLRLV